jgi:hypothetical protein
MKTLAIMILVLIVAHLFGDFAGGSLLRVTRRRFASLMRTGGEAIKPPLGASSASALVMWGMLHLSCRLLIHTAGVFYYRICTG